MSSEPRYCCAILTDSRGRFVFERRPADETDAPGMLTCFGGGREENEDPDSCLRRELREELGFEAGELVRVFTLHTPRGEAWFYRQAFDAAGPEEGTVHALEPGFEAVWVDPADARMREMGAWHRVVFDALARGQIEAWVE